MENRVKGIQFINVSLSLGLFGDRGDKVRYYLSLEDDGCSTGIYLTKKTFKKIRKHIKKGEGIAFNGCGKTGDEFDHAYIEKTEIGMFYLCVESDTATMDVHLNPEDILALFSN